MAGRYGNLDYSRLTKFGFLLGASLLAIGAGGSALGPALAGSLPAWERTLFVDMAFLGVLIGLLSPILFCVVLPLTE